MLDLVFVRLVTAGIERLCGSPQGIALPAVPPVEPEQFIRQLIANTQAPIGDLIGHCVKVIWHSCQAVGLPAELAEPHLAALPAMIRSTAFSPDDYELFLAPEELAIDGAISDLTGRTMAASTETTTSPELDETILNYLLETFYRCLVTSRKLVQAIRPHAIDILTKSSTSTSANQSKAPDPSKAAVTLAKIERADALGISVPLLEAITVALINLTKRAELRSIDLRAAASRAIEIDVGLRQLPVRAPKFRDILEHVITTYRAGKLSECDRQLAIIEDEIVKLSFAGALRDTELANLAIELRALRGNMHNLMGAFVKSARHFGFSQRYIPRADTETRWHFARMEAENYELSAYCQPSVPSSLQNAARACTGALAAIENNSEPSMLKSDAQSALAHVLILIGEREMDPARFELAAQLLADAQLSIESVLEASGNPSGSEELLRQLQNTINLRATALNRLGEFHENSDLIEQAAVLFQSLLTGDHPADETDAHEVRARLALALVSYGRLARQPEFSKTAVETIRRELPKIELAALPYNKSKFSNAVLAARCHQILADFLNMTGDDNTATEHRGLANNHWQSIGFSARTRKVLPSQTNVDAATENDARLSGREANAA